MGFIDEQVLSHRVGGLLTVLVGVTAASADEFLGSYVARISEQDHQASDGYPLDTAAQMVRQDRANWHKFGTCDPEDQNDLWFRTNDQRARLERMLGQGGAMSEATRSAIVNGEPLIQVDVYRNHVEVTDHRLTPGQGRRRQGAALAYPAIFEKSATWPVAARMRASSARRLARTAGSSSFTSTCSKNESTGSRNALSARMAAEKSSLSIASPASFSA